MVLSLPLIRWDYWQVGRSEQVFSYIIKRLKPDFFQRGGFTIVRISKVKVNVGYFCFLFFLSETKQFGSVA